MPYVFPFSSRGGSHLSNFFAFPNGPAQVTGNELSNARPSFSATPRTVRRLVFGIPLPDSSFASDFLRGGRARGRTIRFQGSYLPIRKFFEPEHDVALVDTLIVPSANTALTSRVNVGYIQVLKRNYVFFFLLLSIHHAIFLF